MKELELFFQNYKGSNEIRLNAWTYIHDIKYFVSSHLDALKSNKGNRTFLPYYMRLNELYKLLND
jgi:hypothetical protein